MGGGQVPGVPADQGAARRGARPPGATADDRVHEQLREGPNVQLGLVGLGKMGGNMAQRVRRAGHEVVGYDRAPGTRDVDSLESLVGALEAPRVVWVMVPSGEPTRATVRALGELLSEGDVIVDGGNSKFTDDQVHADALAPKGIGYVDAGVSGGVWGLENGYALMVGGSAEDVAKAPPGFHAV